ncbi:alpha/beta hydrolase [Bradyrhizobium sp. Leo170]|uniref:alpha/beta fold hydrolase n=1 Tax=Bradyrhizobium sp. Leo170 TaxID=1571199 RepID=UPI00102EBF9A|nr:alpha/beta hydrolase [Bradyrhizobium sp. Leo170]TAI63914.1 alpha/beta hydrolase [Bradyrhizobium sp. Leo170]
MSAAVTKDDARIFYKDWGSGQPVVFSHPWPLNADSWDNQLFFIASRGYRAVAHDRRGHGRSSQTWHGNDMDTFADDLAAVIEALDLKNIILVGHSMGGGEVTRYIGRYGTERVAKVLLVGATPPLMLKTEANPDGLALSVFDGIRTGLSADRADYFKDLAVRFLGANRDGSRISRGMLDEFWLQAMQNGLKAVYDCVKAFSETDLTEDLKKFDVPTLFIHGDDDQTVPIEVTARLASKLVKNARLKVYAGGSHGLPATNRNEFNADLLAFVQE